MSTTIDITLPASVWDDYLDPNTSTMEAELELPKSTYRRMGKGGQVRYKDVPIEVARELAEYLADRAEGLLGNGEQESCHYAARKAAAKIEEALR